MADASTMFLTMKRLMALSLGTITPEASQRTRRTCKPQQHLLYCCPHLNLCASLLTALIANLPDPCHACCVLLQSKTRLVKIRDASIKGRLLPSILQL